MAGIMFRPRLSVDITENQSQKLSKYLDFGMKKVVFGVIVDDLIYLIEKYGAGKVLGLLLERSITLKEISKINLKED